MELEIKHLAAYLPYGLNLLVYTNTVNPILMELAMLGNNHSRAYVESKHFSGWVEDFKPILRPLSDLTKEIDHNGERFVPMMDLFMCINDIHMVDLNYGKLDYSDNNVTFGCDEGWNYWICFSKPDIVLSYDITEQRFALMRDCEYLDFNYIEMHDKLLDLHFDVFNLIPNNLAIDINTLDK